jgi:hypothetical protein
LRLPPNQAFRFKNRRLLGQRRSRQARVARQLGCREFRVHKCADNPQTPRVRHRAQKFRRAFRRFVERIDLHLYENSVK